MGLQNAKESILRAPPAGTELSYNDVLGGARRIDSSWTEPLGSTPSYGDSSSHGSPFPLA